MAVKQMNAPTNITELRRLAEFTLQLSEATKSLQELLSLKNQQLCSDS